MSAGERKAILSQLAGESDTLRGELDEDQSTHKGNSEVLGEVLTELQDSKALLSSVLGSVASRAGTILAALGEVQTSLGTLSGRGQQHTQKVGEICAGIEKEADGTDNQNGLDAVEQVGHASDKIEQAGVATNGATTTATEAVALATLINKALSEIYGQYEDLEAKVEVLATASHQGAEANEEGAGHMEKAHEFIIAYRGPQ